MRQAIVITGGAGFIGSHLADRYVAKGWSVYVVDDLSSGDPTNLSQAASSGRLHVFYGKAEDPEMMKKVSAAALANDDQLAHIALLASPATPDEFVRNPIGVLHAGGAAVEHWLLLATKVKARVLFASTSEVYGDPLIHPQHEGYRGNVDPVGVRGCYDEAKRYGEALCAGYHRMFGVDARIVRIFNTYGPRMPRDGRVMPTFIERGLRGAALPVQGDGRQTRTFCYVDDLVDGLQMLLHRESGFAEHSVVATPINLGNQDDEITMLDLARAVNVATSSKGGIEMRPGRPDDPKQRRPVLARADRLLGYYTKTSLTSGLVRTVSWCRGNWMAVADEANAPH